MSGTSLLTVGLNDHTNVYWINKIIIHLFGSVHHSLIRRGLAVDCLGMMDMLEFSRQLQLKLPQLQPRYISIVRQLLAVGSTDGVAKP